MTAQTALDFSPLAHVVDGLGAAHYLVICDAIRYVARSLPTFTVEDVRPHLPALTLRRIAKWQDDAKTVPGFPNALAAAFHNLRDEGVIRQTNEYRRSTRPERRGAAVAVWERA